MPLFRIIVGDVVNGTIDWEGAKTDVESAAQELYRDYVGMSKHPRADGRGGSVYNQRITLTADGRIIKEYIPDVMAARMLGGWHCELDHKAAPRSAAGINAAQWSARIN